MLTPNECAQRVIFRRWCDTGEVIAFFPDQQERDGLMGSYMHVGQHGPASYPNKTRPARMEEPDVLALWRELTYNVGYRLRVVSRLNYQRKGK